MRAPQGGSQTAVPGHYVVGSGRSQTAIPGHYVGGSGIQAGVQVSSQSQSQQKNLHDSDLLRRTLGHNCGQVVAWRVIWYDEMNWGSLKSTES